MKRAFRIGIVTSDHGGWHSQRLFAAASRVAEAAMLDPLDLSVRVNGQGAGVYLAEKPAEYFDALILRGLNEEGLPDFQLDALRMAEDSVPVVVNRVEGVLTALDKARSGYLLRRAGLPTPPTVVTQRLAVAEAAVKGYGEAVLKPLYGSLGESIVRVTDTPEGKEQVAEMLDRYGAIVVQRFEPPGGEDVRAFVVGDTVIAAIRRRAPAGEWITNVSRGATVEMFSLPPEQAALCVQATRVVGLDYTGVDLIETPAGPTIIEVNGSPSGEGVESASGVSVAEAIVAHVIDRLQRGGPRDTDPAYPATA